MTVFIFIVKLMHHWLSSVVFEFSDSLEFEVQLSTHNFGFHIVNSRNKSYLTRDHYLYT